MKSRISIFLLLVSVIVLSGCPNLAVTDKDNEDEGGNGSGLTFDLSGAKAIGVADIANSRALIGVKDLDTARSIARQASDQYGLVKVLEDGTVEMAITLPDGIWMPRVLFLATSPIEGNKDVYVAFESSISYWDETNNTQVDIGSFLHIKEDGTYNSIITKSNGRVKNYSWYGNDNYKPISFDSSGRLFYVFESWGTSSSSDQLFVYDPSTKENTPITPALSGTQFTNFEVSSDGLRLFVQGDRYSGNSKASFFSMYPVNDVENPVRVFYSSNSNTWVRGYKVSPANASPQNVILNGYNIRGINGLLRANVVSDQKLTYEPLFDSSTDWFQVDYNEWFSEWENKTYVNGYFDCYSSYNTYLAMSDGTTTYYMGVSDFNWKLQESKWQELVSLSVLKEPLENDWVKRGSTSRNLMPIESADKFAFVSTDSTDTSTVLLLDTVKTTLADIQDPAYTLKTYYDNLTDEQKKKIKVVYIRDTWNNGTSTRVLENAPYQLLPIFAETDPAKFSSNAYSVNKYWLNDDGTPKTAEFLSYAEKYFIDPVQFKYSTYAPGDESLKAFFDKKVFIESELKKTSGGNDPDYFLNTYFVKADGTPGLTFRKYKEDNNINWLNFQNVSALHYDNTGACWAIIGGNMWGGSSSIMRPIKILKPDGSKTLEIIPALNNSDYNPVSFLIEGNTLFFRDGLLDSDSFETGYHKLYKLDLTSPAAVPVDLLANVAENGKLEIISFSVEGNILYFTGVKGSGVIGGRIDIDTLAFTPLSETYLLRDIEIY